CADSSDLKASDFVGIWSYLNPGPPQREVCKLELKRDGNCVITYGRGPTTERAFWSLEDGVLEVYYVSQRGEHQTLEKGRLSDGTKGILFHYHFISGQKPLGGDNSAEKDKI